MEPMHHGGTGIEETGFGYTMSLVSGKYKMIILYWLAEYSVLRYNELKRRLGTISHKTLSLSLKELEADGLVQREEYPQIPPRWSTASRSGASPSSPSWTTCASGGTTTASDPPVPGRFFEHFV